MIRWILLFIISSLLQPLYCKATDPKGSVSFIANKKQWENGSVFMADIPQGKIGFYPDKFRFYMFGRDGASSTKFGGKGVDHGHHSEHDLHAQISQVHIYDVTFENAEASANLEGRKQQITQHNYFYGSDSREWLTNVPSFSALHYDEVYCGIDLDVYSVDNRLKYEWIVAPGHDPKTIVMRYDGVSGMRVENEHLQFATSVGAVLEMKPYAYQIKMGEIFPVQCFFKVHDGRVTFDLPKGYDDCYPLIIDPILIFSAYSGSSLDNWGNTATHDSKGNAYSGGIVANPLRATGFPTTPGSYRVNAPGGAWDVGILKFDSAGSSLLYATYFGGSKVEIPQSLVVNSKDELLILGVTSSTDLPITTGLPFSGGTTVEPISGISFDGGTDLYVTKLSENGSALLSSTYLGGKANDGVNRGTSGASVLAKNYGDELRGDIYVGANDTVFVASNTLSADFRGCTNAFNGGGIDAVIVKLNPNDLAVKTARYYGGVGQDAAYSLKIYQDTVYVGGGTNSTQSFSVPGFSPAAKGNIDGWIAAFRQSDFALTAGSYLGTTSYDQVYFIDINKTGEVYAFGQTRGAYPVSVGVYSNMNSGQFIHKISRGLKRSIFSTVIGSSPLSGNVVNPNISPTAFLVNECNENIFLGGWGGSQINSPAAGYIGGGTFNMPTTTNAFQRTTQGNDFYFMVLSADASKFLYGTFLGGTNSRTHVDGGTSRFDKKGIVYHAVCAGCGSGSSSDFPAVNVPAQFRTNRSTNCNNAVFKFDLALLTAAVRAPQANVCLGEPVTFENESTAGALFEWTFGDGTGITIDNNADVVHTFEKIGTFTVKLVITDLNTCNIKDSTSVSVTVLQPQGKVQEDDVICKGDSYTLQATGGNSYNWFGEDKSLLSTSRTPIIRPSKTSTYYVTVRDIGGCEYQDTVVIKVIDPIKPKLELQRMPTCEGRPVVSFKNTTDSLLATDLTFVDWGDGQKEDRPEGLHNYEQDGLYTVRLIASREICVSTVDIQVPIYFVRVPNVITPDVEDGKNDRFTIRMGEEGQTPLDFNAQTSLVMYNRWGRFLFEDKNYQHDWRGDSFAAGVYYFEVTIDNELTCRSWLHLLR